MIKYFNDNVFMFGKNTSRTRAPFMNFFVQKIVISSKNVNLINDMYTQPNKVNSILLTIIID